MGDVEVRLSMGEIRPEDKLGLMIDSKATVRKVEPGEFGELSGFKKGDVILEIVRALPPALTTMWAAQRAWHAGTSPMPSVL